MIFRSLLPDAPLAEEENVGGSLGPSVVGGFVSRRPRAPQSTRAGSDPDGTRTTPSPFAKPADPASAEVSTLAQCLAAIALKFAYMRAPCGSEHTLSGWNCTPKCGRVTCSSAITAPPARSSEMSSAVTHSLTNKPSSFSESVRPTFRFRVASSPPFFLSSPRSTPSRAARRAFFFRATRRRRRGCGSASARNVRERSNKARFVPSCVTKRHDAVRRRARASHLDAVRRRQQLVAEADAPHGRFRGFVDDVAAHADVSSRRSGSRSWGQHDSREPSDANKGTSSSQVCRSFLITTGGVASAAAMR